MDFTQVSEIFEETDVEAANQDVQAGYTLVWSGGDEQGPRFVFVSTSGLPLPKTAKSPDAKALFDQDVSSAPKSAPMTTGGNGAGTETPGAAPVEAGAPVIQAPQADFGMQAPPPH